jgi:hypothetical protein
VTRSGTKQVGAFVRYQAEELTRIWRLARAEERKDVFPGLLDGLLESFFNEAGSLLEQGGAPEDVIRRTAGALRWPPALAPAEISEEWRIVADVLQTAADSVTTERGADEWLAAAVAAAEAGTTALDGGRGPALPRVAVVLVLSSTAPVVRDR